MQRMKKEEREERELAIEKAAQAAYHEDAYMVVGKIDGFWTYCHTEDCGRIAQMDYGTEVKVGSSGVQAEPTDQQYIDIAAAAIY